MTKASRFLILGGGISGLSAAYRLLQKVSNASDITIVERTSRLGGWIQSKRYEDGTVFELGPRGLRPAGLSGRSSLELAYDLGMEKQIIAVSTDHVSAKNRFIFAHNKLHKLPFDIVGLLKPQSLLSKSLLSILIKEPFIPKETDLDDESIYNFISRRYNSEVADYIVDPMCRGIFAGDIKKLSMKSCLPPVYNLEKESGSVLKGMLMSKSPAIPQDASPLVKNASSERWSLWTLENGLETLVERLETVLVKNGVNILKNKSLITLKFLADGVVEAQGGEETLLADHVISSIPTKSLAALMLKEHSPLASHLRRIDAVTVGVVNLEFEGSVSQLQGFGFLYPSSQSKRVLGVIFDSSTFPQCDSKTSLSTRFTVMLGGNLFQDEFGDPDKADKEKIKIEALDALRNALNIETEPSKIHVSIHKDCIPQYYVGHGELLRTIRNYTTINNLPLTLIGAWYDGVGLNDCIYHSQSNVDKIFENK